MNTIGRGAKSNITVQAVNIRKPVNEDLDNDETTCDFDSDLEFVAGGNGYESCRADRGSSACNHVTGERKLTGLPSPATSNAFTPCGDGKIYSKVDFHKDFIQPILSHVKN